MKSPGDLFEKDEVKVKQKLRELSKSFHPDTGDDYIESEATGERIEKQEVFTRVKELYDMAITMLQKGVWEKEGLIEIRSDAGKTYQIRYDYDMAFELGHMYTTKNKVIYVLASDKEKYYKNYIERAEGIRFKNRDMEKNFRFAIPRIYTSFKDVYDNYVIIVEKTIDEYPLNKVVSHFGGSLEARHVAWIISRLCNMACFLEANNLSSNGMDVNSLFINPKDHSISYYGAFFYMVEIDENLIGTTTEIFEVMPPKIKSKKKAGIGTDLESIKLIGRTLLGDKNVVTIKSNKKVPEAILEFVTDGAGVSSFEEFDKWDRALSRAYGRREFIPMNYPG